MAADGSIIVSTNIDNEQAQKELNKLEKKIEGINEKIYTKEQQKIPLLKQAQDLGVELDAAKAKLENIKSGEGFFSAVAIKEQQATVTQIQKEWDGVNNRIDRINAGIQNDNVSLDIAKEKAGELAMQLHGPGNSVAAAAEKVNERFQKFERRLVGLAKRVFVFSVITTALRGMRTWLSKVIKSNSEASAAVAKLKGALLTLAQPLVEVIIPAFTTLVNILTKVISVVASLVSMLFGKSLNSSKEAAKNLYNESNAIASVGSTAEEASGQLASFDEINKLSSETGGGAGASTEEIAPDFDFFSDLEQYKNKLDEFTVYLSGMLLALGAILTFSGANIPLGLGLMAIGALGLAAEVKEKWDAVDGKVKGAVNRVLITLGLAGLVIGAILAFSGVNIALGIGLMIAGATSLGAAVALNWNQLSGTLQDAITSTLIVTSVVLLTIGAALAFSGANITSGIGLMAAGALSLGAAAALDWNKVKGNLNGIITSIVGILGLALVVGAVLAFSGGHIALGIGLMIAGAASLGAAVALNWGWLVTQLRGELGTVVAVASLALLALGIILVAAGVSLPLGIALIAAGAVGLVTVTALNWDAIVKKLQEVWQSIKNWWNTHVAKYFSLAWWKQKGSEIIDGLLAGIKGVWSTLSNWVNTAWNKLMGGLTIDASNVTVTGRNTAKSTRTVTTDIPTVSSFSIPALATGAVIPPNREFMAILGDQRSGNNIEAPESLIRQIFNEESSKNSGQIISLMIQMLGYLKEGQTLSIGTNNFNKAVARANRTNERTGAYTF